MKRKRDEDELDEVVHKMSRLEPTLKRKHDENAFEANKRIRTEGSYHYTLEEYKKIIVSLYHQNVRLLKRAKDAEQAHKDLIKEIEQRALDSRKWQCPTSPRYIPTVVM